MAAIDGRLADRIADTLTEWGWRVLTKGRAHTYQVYPPGGGVPLVVSPGAGREAANTFANLRRCGVEFDPKRRQVTRRATAASTAGGRATPAPPPRPVSPPPPAPRPVPAALPLWALALRFGEHAWDRMSERRVTDWEVRAAVAFPEYTRESHATPGRIISTRGDIAVVTQDQFIVTVIDRLAERDVPRSPAAAPASAGLAVPNRVEVVVSTSEKIRVHVRTLAGEFAVSEVVAELDDPLVSSGLVSQVLLAMMDGGEVRRVGRGRYTLTQQPAAAAADRRIAERLSEVATATRPIAADADETRALLRQPAAAPKSVPRPRPPAAAPAPVFEFEWAAVDPPPRLSAAAVERHQLQQLVDQHLDALKQQPGRWATIATYPATATVSMVQDRARGLRDAFPGVGVRVAGRSVYVTWEGE